ncbi:SAM-dependent methyltransferase [Mesorhizobium sp. LHD-90]|uniref:protein-L-isoaspartate O-methyltransferase family protein n=1 Tax=Mesorhizobium sp. LHD-90 TaxID=3071414 RepID=UPI0027DFF818|nr:rRNA adenine N-6-methyltransferase family protein [Mesorhizobium sp. LHD-90]MDQ6434902.1 SAM-dependent methyltransferase [Mesorhizobium sp. LHD-90]
MARRRTGLDEVRAHYARQMAAMSGSHDPRIARAFDLVRREAFLPPGPWQVVAGDQLISTPSDDPAFLYQNVLVAIDREKGINNGEPFLHAAWIGAVAPQPGEAVTHIGTGGGYYTAVLAVLVRPDGTVTGFEVDSALAAYAAANLKPYENVTVVAANAVTSEIPPSDIVYVSAGVAAPPLCWLSALKPGGRIVFPWRPAHEVGLAVLARRTEQGFAAKIIGSAWFIGCAGASDFGRNGPTSTVARQIKSIVPTGERPPDQTALAIYPELWFSSALPE